MSPASETTEAGEQRLVTGVRSITLRDRLDWQAAQPLRPKRNPDCQKRACDLGLFDEVGRAQIDLIDLLRAERKAEP